MNTSLAYCLNRSTMCSDEDGFANAGSLRGFISEFANETMHGHPVITVYFAQFGNDSFDVDVEQFDRRVDLHAGWRDDERDPVRRGERARQEAQARKPV